MILDHSAAVPALLGRRLTLAYMPFSPEDAEVVQQYGGLSRTPPYLIEVRPVLKSAGIVIASGDGPVGMGVRYTLRLELKGPGGTQTVSNTVLAGNMIAIGLGGRMVTNPEAIDGQAAQILSGLAARYLESWNDSDLELTNLLRVVPVRPIISACFVLSEIDIEYAGGDPLYPISFEWKGIAIDADLRATAPVGVETRETERSFLLISGLEGSILENRVFEDVLQIPSISTAKALALAASEGVTVYDLTAENVDAVLPGLPLDPRVKDEVKDATARGFLARVPGEPITHLDWTGVGYLLLDEQTGEAAYQLQGGHSGGVTAPAALQIPANIRDPLAAQGEDPEPLDSVVANISKFDSTDFQEGIVDKVLERPLKVLVTDKDGFAAANQPVIFTVIGGEGSFPGNTNDPGASEITVLSDDRGEAAATLKLGRHTNLIPRYLIEDGDENATQVGLNLVTVRSGAVSVSAPFTEIAFPDRQPVGDLITLYLTWKGQQHLGSLPNLTVAALMALGVDDQHGNPISNAAIRFAFSATSSEGTGPNPELASVPEGWSAERGPTTTPGKLLTVESYLDCLPPSGHLRYGECSTEVPSVTVGSTATGAYAYASIGDSPYSIYWFDMGTTVTPRLGSIGYPTVGWLCHTPNPNDCPLSSEPHAMVSFGNRTTITNALGNLVEAYLPGASATVGLWADVLYEKERLEEFFREGDPTPHYRAIGINEWLREPLTDSTYALQAAGGTTVDAEATHVGQGQYEAQMTMAGTPKLNTVRYTGTHLQPLIPYLPGTRDVDPAEVVPGSPPTLRRRIKDPAQPIRADGAFSLWGVKPEVTAVAPEPFLLTSAGTVPADASVSYSITPTAYVPLLATSQLRLDVHRDNTLVLEAYGNGGAPFIIPMGLALTPGDYDAVLNILGVSRLPGRQSRPAGRQAAPPPPSPIPSPPKKISVVRIAILDDTTPWRPQRHPTQTMRVVFKGPADLNTSTVRLLVSGPAALPTTYTPTTGLVTKVQNTQDRYTFEWTGPWELPGQTTPPSPLPRGRYALKVAATRQGAQSEITSGAREVALVEVIKVDMSYSCPPIVVCDEPPMPLGNGEPAYGPNAPNARVARTGGGKRIFADAGANVVTLSATVDPQVVGATVYFKAVDADDPDHGNIDDDRDPPNTFAADNRGAALFPNGSSSNTSGSPAVAQVTIEVSRKPGDNYRFVASTTPAMPSATPGTPATWLQRVNGLQPVGRAVAPNTTALAQGALGLDPTSTATLSADDELQATDLLTVWRTLNVSLEATEASASAGPSSPQRNFLIGSILRMGGPSSSPDQLSEIEAQPDVTGLQFGFDDRSPAISQTPCLASLFCGGRYENGTVSMGDIIVAIKGNKAFSPSTNSATLITRSGAGIQAEILQPNATAGTTVTIVGWLAPPPPPALPQPGQFTLHSSDSTRIGPAYINGTLILGGPYFLGGQSFSIQSVVAGTNTTIAVAQQPLSFRLVDDDSLEPLLYHSQLMQGSDDPDLNPLATAYVQPVFEDLASTAPYARNIDPDAAGNDEPMAQAQLARGHRSASTEEQWRAYLQFASQEHSDRDSDPDWESNGGTAHGWTPQPDFDYRGSLIFYEANGDFARKVSTLPTATATTLQGVLDETMLHEVIHQFNVSRDCPRSSPCGIMTQGVSTPPSYTRPHYLEPEELIAVRSGRGRQ